MPLRCACAVTQKNQTHARAVATKHNPPPASYTCVHLRAPFVLPHQPAAACCARIASQQNVTMSSLDYKEDARDLHAFKELRFFLSHSVPLEIRCSVSRLELPLVADYLLGGGDALGNRGSSGADRGDSRQKEKRGENAEGDGLAMAALVRRVVSEPELVATCQLFSDGQPMHKVAMRCEQSGGRDRLL